MMTRILARAGALALCIFWAAAANADKSDRAADRFASRANVADGMFCMARHNSRTIVCIVMVDDNGLERVATSGLIMLARTHDLPLVGWSLMLVT